MAGKKKDRTLKIAGGTLQKCRDSKTAPEATAGEFANPFQEGTHAHTVWDRQYTELRTRGSLSQSYADMLESYCDACQRMRDARAALDAVGVVIETDRGLVKNPAFGVFAECARIIRSTGSEFGFSPSSVQNTFSELKARRSIKEFSKAKTG